MVSVNRIGGKQTNYLNLIPNLSDEDIQKIFKDDFNELKNKEKNNKSYSNENNKPRKNCWITLLSKFSFRKNSNKKRCSNSK